MLNSISQLATMLLILIARFNPRDTKISVSDLYNHLVAHNSSLPTDENSLYVRQAAWNELHNAGLLAYQEGDVNNNAELSMEAKKMVVALLSNRNGRLNVGDLQGRILSNLISSENGNSRTKLAILPHGSQYDYRALSRLEQRGMVEFHYPASRNGLLGYNRVAVSITPLGFAAYSLYWGYWRAFDSNQ